VEEAKQELTMNRALVPVVFGTAAVLLGAETNTSGVNLAAVTVTVMAGHFTFLVATTVDLRVELVSTVRNEDNNDPGTAVPRKY
jgi:hypothetical protein